MARHQSFSKLFLWCLKFQTLDRMRPVYSAVFRSPERTPVCSLTDFQDENPAGGIRADRYAKLRTVNLLRLPLRVCDKLRGDDGEIAGTSSPLYIEFCSATESPDSGHSPRTWPTVTLAAPVHDARVLSRVFRYGEGLRARVFLRSHVSRRRRGLSLSILLESRIIRRGDITTGEISPLIL